MKISDFKSEFEKYAESMSMLNGLRSNIERTCVDNSFLEAKKAKEEALITYTRELNRCVLNDKEYNKIQKEMVRLAVHEFARVHKASSFAVWYDDNGKDEQKTLIDSTTRLCSHIVSLYKDFKKGYITAKENSKKKLTRAEQIAALQKQIAALQAQD